MIKFILRCNIERQIFLLYELVGSEDLSKLQDHQEKLNLDENETRIIQFLHEKEGVLQEEPASKLKEESFGESLDGSNEAHSLAPPEQYKSQTVIADKLVFAYVKYLVLVLSRQSLHLKGLSITDLVLRKPSTRDGINKRLLESSKERETYLQSCMLQQQIQLDEGMVLNIDSNTFIKNILTQNDQSPWNLLLHSIQGGINKGLDTAKCIAMFTPFQKSSDPDFDFTIETET